VQFGGFEPLAAADRGDHQVQRGVLRVAALFDQVVRGLMRRADLNQLLWLLGLLTHVFAEVGTEPALPVVYVKHFHRFSPFVERGERCTCRAEVAGCALESGACVFINYKTFFLSSAGRVIA
jgi:hypothetical protein